MKFIQLFKDYLVSRSIQLVVLFIVTFTPIDIFAQSGNVPTNLPSGRAFRRVGFHNGNRVLTKFQNDGLVGSRTYVAPLLPSLAWKEQQNEYIYDLQTLFGIEREFKDTIILGSSDNASDTTRGTRLRDNRTNVVVPRNNPNLISIKNILVDSKPAVEVVIRAKYVTTQQGPRSGGYRIVNGQFEGLQPITGFFNPIGESPAISTDPSTWPNQWPDQPTWIDPATGKAEWNGYFGRNVFNADQESYFVFDDATDKRWFEEFGFQPRSDEPNRFGVGLQVKARGLQWSSFLAQDNIFLVYDVKNISDYDYNKVVFGTVVGTAVGGQAGAPSNVSVFDQRRSVTYTYNPSNIRESNWVGNVGLVGVAFLESPGNPFDGIDNDDDWNAISQGPYSVSNKGIPDQFKSIPVGQISNTGYDFYEFEYSIDNSSFRARGENAIRVLKAGDFVITIKDTLIRTPEMVSAGYNQFIVVPKRAAYQIPQSGKILLESQGIIFQVGVGDTLKEVSSNLIDDNLNGIIDEDYRLHFRRIQFEADLLNPGRSVPKELPPLRFVNYIQLAINGENLLDPLRFPMIDERRDDGIDNNGDWTFLDDLGSDGSPSSQDLGESDGRPTAGESQFDATDIRESDQIGLSSYKFDLSGQPRMGNSDDLWRITTPGLFDSLDVTPKDGDYTYGTGYFPLKRGQIERFSVSVVYGDNAQELLRNIDIVQEIYNNNYRFTGPPLPSPLLSAVPGDKKVTLYWTSEGETYFDRFINRKLAKSPTDTTLYEDAFTFEGYKIYKSTDPSFNDSRLISGGQGEIGFRTVPIAQFDKINGILGYFPMVGSSLLNQARGVSFYRGNETGLVHTLTDTDVQNGKTYYYAVANYSRGFIPLDSLNRPDYNAAIFPSENAIKGFFDSRGVLRLPPNAVSVVPSPVESGINDPNNSKGGLTPALNNKGNGSVEYTVLNNRKFNRPKKIELEFVDTSSDTLDNNNNGLKDINDPIESKGPFTSYFRIIDKADANSIDTILHRSGYVRTRFVRPMYEISSYEKDQEGKFVYRASDETEVVNKLGVYFTVKNPPQTNLDTAIWRFKNPRPYGRINNGDTVAVVTSMTSEPLLSSIKGLSIKAPADYALIIQTGSSSDSATVLVNNNPILVPSYSTNFFIYDLTNKKKKRFILDRNLGGPDRGLIGKAAINLSILELDLDQNGKRPVLDTLFSWRIQIASATRYTVPENGDTILIKLNKPFLNGDKFTLNIEPLVQDQERIKNNLENIRVFPNPYIVTNTAETNLIGKDSRGRSSRKLFFKNVPLKSTIRIYTIRGELIRTLKADDPSNELFGQRDRESSGLGTFNYPTSLVEWDLKSSENLDIAYGVYLYHVDAPGVGTKTGKFAVIK
ncbi:MAG: hypothetical protein SFU91_02200 [Chloroherpetonaceae bacterium]|nr:hypothetical protein [Chloroherpetonaceae bacterium]